MLAHPILIKPSIVVTPKGVKLCRSEAVLDLLDHPVASFVREDGEAVTRAKTVGHRLNFAAGLQVFRRG